MLDRSIQAKLGGGRPVFGTFVKLATPAITEILGLSGFDFVILDAEHGAFGHAEVENAIRAAEVTGMSAIVRVPDVQETHILHALDAGAAGVQAPSLKSAREAEDAAKHVHFHPNGSRGFARVCRAGRYGVAPLPEFFSIAGQSLFVVHLENREMLADVDALCASTAVDVVFFGAGDLSQAFGHPGDSRHADVRAAFEALLAAAAKHGKPVGAVAASAADIEALLARGVKYIVWQSDVAMLNTAAQLAVTAFTKASGGL